MKSRIFKGKSLFYGWIIVAAAALGAFFSGPGQTYSVSIFINSYIDGFGWSRSLVSGYYSIATLIAGFTLPLVGKAVDKFGHRKMFAVIPTLLGLTCLWMSIVSHPIMLIVGFFFLRLLGQGSMSLLPSTLVAQWFSRHRGKALSIMGIGGVASFAFFPPANNWLIQNFGAETGWRVWSLALLLVMLPVGWFLVRDKPEDMGETPDGKTSKETKEKKKKDTPKRIVFKDNPWMLGQAMKTRAYWFMIYCTSVPAMINTGVTFHMVSIMQTKGFTPTFAALILSVIAMVQFPMTFVAGFMVDRFKIHIIKAIGYLVYAANLLILLLGTSQQILLVYAALHGVFMAFESVSTNVLWPNYFGRKYQGTIRGTAMTAMVIGSSLGPLPFGFAYDYFSGYSEILFIMMIFSLTASIPAFFSPPPIYSHDGNGSS